MNSNLCDIEMEIIARTPKAVLAHTGDSDKAVWLPLSQIEIADTGSAGIDAITMTEGLAQEKGLI